MHVIKDNTIITPPVGVNQAYVIINIKANRFDNGYTNLLPSLGPLRYHNNNIHWIHTSEIQTESVLYQVFYNYILCAWYESLGLIPGPTWKMSCNNLLI